MPQTLKLTAGLLALSLLAAPAAGAEPEHHVLVYGNSLSWGWMPTERGFPTTRYPEEQRWTTVLAQGLGPGWHVAVDAVSGRTTDVDYAKGMGTLTGADFNGLKSLPDAIAAQMPLDLVVVMLGTNDLRSDVGHAPSEIAAGAMRVADLARHSTGVATVYPPPKVLVVIPPLLGDVSKTPIRNLMQGAQAKSKALAAAYRAAVPEGVALFDAGAATTTDGVDGIYFTPQDNDRLGRALAPVVRDLFTH